MDADPAVGEGPMTPILMRWFGLGIAAGAVLLFVLLLVAGVFR